MKQTFRVNWLSLGLCFWLFQTTVLAAGTGANNRQNEPIIFVPPVMQQQSAPAINQPPPFKLPPGVIYRDGQDAVEADMALFSRQAGIPLDQVKASQAFQDAFYEYAEKVRARYPDKVSGVWVEPVPAKVGGIRFVGKVPLELLSAVQKRGQGKQIRLLDGGKVLEKNHADYTREICETLIDMELTNLTCAYNVPADHVDIEINTLDTTMIPDQVEILQAIWKRIYRSRLLEKEAVLLPADINLKVYKTNGSVFSPTFHRGGMGAFRANDPGLQCTTGWSVSGPVGDGIVTAGHCDHNRGGLNSYTVNHYPMYRMNYQYAPWTQDAAYYINPDYPATPFFYADFTDIRRVRHVKPVNTMIGRTVCRYGRASNFRSCGHIVTSISAVMSFGSVFHPVWPYALYPMVKVTNDTSRCGDSGGGWSWGTTAWGVHAGRSTPAGLPPCAGPLGQNPSIGYFTPLEDIESYFGVTVKLVP